ncbi:class I adenylate-forming enzyme family protein [Actinocorallia longicatena]|uniref:ATP-dependent acyl-CoA ligase n=1 Tax=Actinocorallia longicatena TaxID=111803 RepID=A0ABP6Q7X3_9ACTN
MDESQVAASQFAGQDIPWLLRTWAERQPDKALLIWEPRDGTGRTWTYAQFWSDVRGLAAGLAERGVAEGDKILLHADNCPEMVLAWYACATLGAVAVTTNTRSAASEVAFFVEKTGCAGAITQPRHAAVVKEAAPGLPWIAVTGDDSGAEPAAGDADHGLGSFDELFGDGDSLPVREPDPMAPAGILFTSGTTSRPKAVVHTHANALWAGRVGPVNISLTGDDTYLIYLPFFHVNAQSWALWTVLGAGGTVVLQPKFSSSRFWEVVVAHKVTHISLLPFVINAVISQPVPENSLKAGVFGLVVPELEALLGFSVVPAYGMTETVIHATSQGPGLPLASRSMGRPTPGYEMLVVDQETGEICAEDQAGELWVRGTRGIQLFLEYYDNPEAMAKSFTEDGWFKTGDIVRWTAGGSIVYCERDADLLKVGGENVSAREVEDVCRQVPGVADIAVVSRSHPMLDEVPVAFVVRGPAAEGDDAEFGAALIERCAAALADFKVPRAVHVVADFPRATLEKVAKNKLRVLAEELAEEKTADA